MQVEQACFRLEEQDVVISLLIFLSGCAGLVYEIAWIKKASLIFGSSTLALSTVLATFFLGLGLGSFWFGRFARHARRPFLWCAVLELLLAFNGLLNPFLFGWAEDLYGTIYNRYALDSAALLLLRGGLVAVLLLPPTLLMGGTLPIFCRQLVQLPATIAGSLGRIYGINTLGAAAGCAVTGFALLPALGVSVATRAAVLLNALCGVGFYFLNAKLPAIDAMSPPIARSTDAQAPLRHQAVAGLVLLLAGATALGNEVVWARFLSYLIHNTVYTYTITLTVVLVGTVLGSLWASPRYDYVKNPYALWLVLGGLQTTSALSTMVLTHLPASFWVSLGDGILAYGLLMLPPSILAGALFPLANRLAIAEPGHAPRRVGTMTALNVLGCIMGSLAAGYLLLPEYGLEVSLRVISGLGVAAGMVAAAAGYLSFRPAWKGLAGLTAVMAGAVLWFVTPLLSPARVPQDLLGQPEELVDFDEGYNSSLAVIKRGPRNVLLIDQLWQGSSKKNHQIMAAHVPMAFHPQAKEVLVVGLGVGQTASRFLDHGVARLDIVDIEPKLFDFVRKNFESAWMDDPRVHLVPGDGRNYLKYTRRQYDIMSVEVGQLYRPGVDGFYTVDFYTHARERLRTGGMLVQFLPLTFIREGELRGLLRTFLTVFPKATLWYNTAELLLIGFHGEARQISASGFQQMLSKEQIRRDMDYSYWGGEQYRLNRFEVFLGGFLASGPELEALAAHPDAQVYTDDRSTLAYAVSDFKKGDQRPLALVPLIREHLSPMERVLTGDRVAPATIQAATMVRAYNVGDLAADAILGDIAPESIDTTLESTLPKIREALRWHPKSLSGLIMMGEALVRASRAAEAIPYLEQALEMDPHNAPVRRSLGLALVLTGKR